MSHTPKRRGKLTAEAKQQIAGIVGVGCSRRTAAGFVGCSPNTIYRTARRDPDFAAELRRAESRSEWTYLDRIRKAAMKEQYWRAAAWVLERRNPRDYVLRQPAAMTMERVRQMLLRLVDTIIAQIADRDLRRQVFERLTAVSARFELPAMEKPHDAATE